jgi:tRNA-dihydrouridine synthase
MMRCSSLTENNCDLVMYGQVLKDDDNLYKQLTKYGLLEHAEIQYTLLLECQKRLVEQEDHQTGFKDLLTKLSQHFLVLLQKKAEEMKLKHSVPL